MGGGRAAESGARTGETGIETPVTQRREGHRESTRVFYFPKSPGRGVGKGNTP